MKRTDFILSLTKLYNSIPENASSYHICDVLIRYAERKGMLPPINNFSLFLDGDKADPNNPIYRTWEPEDDDN